MAIVEIRSTATAPELRGREINSQDCEAERGAKRSTGRGAELSQSDNDSNGADQRRTIQARNVRCSR
jgi:hypothetical protein